MDVLAKLAEDRITEALDRGAFDHLPGRGRPLALDDLTGLPDDLRPSYLLLKSAGYLPEELELRKRRLTLQNLIAACHDAEQATRLRNEHAVLLLRLELLSDRRIRGASRRP